MGEKAFVPTMYLMQGCPFCFRLRLFLLEAGLLDQVTIREFVVGTDDENAIKAELAPHFDTLSFPAAQVEPGKYMKGGDAVIARFAESANVDPASLPTLQAFVAGPLAAQIKLYQENMALKKQIA